MGRALLHEAVEQRLWARCDPRDIGIFALAGMFALPVATHLALGSEAETGNVAASFLYAITALHILHLAGGILALIVVLSRAIRKKYTQIDYNGVSMCALYWHFLGALWVYLFFFLFYVR